MNISGTTTAVSYPLKNIPADWNMNLMTAMQKNLDLVDCLYGIPLIPVKDQSQRKFLWRLSKTDQPLVPTNLSKEMEDFLLECNVYFVDKGSLGTNHDLIYNLEIKGYVLNSSNNSSIIGFIEKQAQLLGEQHLIDIISKKNSQNLNSQLLMHISKADQMQNLFFSLPLFPTHSGTGYVNAKQAKLVNKSNVPLEWNNSMFSLVNREDITNTVFEKYGFEEWSRLKISKEMVCKHLNKISNQASFFDCLLEENMDSESVKIFTPHLHILTEDGSRMQPSLLFEKTSLSTRVFFGQKNCFPSPSYHDIFPNLRKFGLKKETDINSNDLAISIGSIKEMTKDNAPWNEGDILAKAGGILEIAVANSIQLQFDDQKWIPVQVEKPVLYPKNLKWFKGGRFVSVKEVFTASYQLFIGSVAPVVSNRVNENFSKCFANRLRQPTVQEMLSHLEMIQLSYDDEEKGSFRKMTIGIYKELSKTPGLMLQQSNMLSYIWAGNNFVPIEQVALVKTTHNLNPYYYEIPNDVANHLHHLLVQSFGPVTEYELYVNVLKQIASKNGGEQTEYESAADLEMSICIVKWLCENQLEDCLVDRENIYVPVETSEVEGLKLFPVTQCHFIEKSRSSKYSGTYSTNKIIHHKLGKEIAAMLEVPSLISKVLGGKRSSFFKACGQTEPLTLRLKRLLDEYRDGLAIVKELIQNADDAGASTVKLLYDKRLNNDKRELLVDEGMSHWQGPALWVYNDKTFSESDFENITKLNAGTKELDTKKIGKFGLGFNSVYHLTDVPSFLSGNDLVVFDPHTCYLGEALESKDVPGIRIPLSEKMDEMASFKHQFEVFHEIFDARFDFQSEYPFSYFDGTLFRLPLRKQEMAEKSEIKQVEYSDNEMKELLSKLRESLDHIILFTEKVKCLEVWEMSNVTGGMTCLFKVEKQNNQQHPASSIVEKANDQLKAIHESGGQLHVLVEQNVTNALEMKVWHGDKLESSRHWLTCSDVGSQESFQFAVDKKGHLPCGGVALPISTVNDKWTLDDHSGVLFCFLPLPIQSCLPIHLNAAFDVSKNRQTLTSLSTDDKSYRKEKDWNKLLSRDLGKSYFNLLKILPNLFPQLSIEEWMTKFMPASDNLSHNQYSTILVKDFLQRLFNKSSDVSVVPTPKGWRPWNKIRCLHQNISKEIAIASIDFMNWCFKGTHECIMFPEAFCKLSYDMGYKTHLDEVTITQEMLFKTFLMNIGNDDLDKNIKDILLDYILGLKLGGELMKLLKTTKCIPTKPNGIFKRPNELVKENSKAAKIYLVKDEVFPLVNESHLEYLHYSLGMQKNHLPWEMLVERAKSIEILHQQTDYQIAEKRLIGLLELMQGCKQKLPNHIKNQLVCIPFLAVLPRPSELAFLPWFYQESDGFAKTSEMFPHELKEVVSFYSLVSKFSLPNNISNIIDKRPSTETVLHQMECLVRFYN